MSGFGIRSVRAREILDGRLEPTLQVTVETDGGDAGRADVPAGRSVGGHEAVERRDGGDRYRGKGVRSAVAAVEDEIGPAVAGLDVRDQRGLDETLRTLDGTERFEALGGNATTGTSLATLRAAADGLDVALYRRVAQLVDRDVGRLPVPHLDVIEGGALGASRLDFQEHQLLPVGGGSFREAIRMGAEVYHELGDRLAARYGEGARGVGDEGGYTPRGLSSPEAAFEAMLEAIESCGYGDEFVLGLDAAATQLYDRAVERYALEGEALTAGELGDRYADLAARYPLATIEDPFFEDAFQDTAALSRRLDSQVVGDDLFATDRGRVRRGVAAGAADALLLKVNQAGTVTRALEAARIARDAGWAVEVSERSGQTTDTWLADLAVGLGAAQLKTGVTRGERTAQYNRLLEIEAALGATASYGGEPLVD